MLTVQGVLDGVMKTLPSNKQSLREVMLVWLNLVMKQLSLDTINWRCLRKTVSRTVTSNTIVLPDDFCRMIYIKKDGTFFLEAENELTEEEAYQYSVITPVNSNIPTGFTVDEVNKTIKLFPGASGSVELKYVCFVPDYVDDNTATLFPVAFSNIFFRACRTFYTEYDCDFEAATVFKFDGPVYNALVISEIEKESLPRMNKHGYLRQRL